AVDLRGDRRVLQGQRLPRRVGAAAPDRREADRRGHGVAVPAVPRLPGAPARARARAAPCGIRPGCLAAGARRLLRGAAGAPLRLLALGRGEGARDGAAARAARRARRVRGRRARSAPRARSARRRRGGAPRDAQRRRRRLARARAPAGAPRGEAAPGARLRAPARGLRRADLRPRAPDLDDGERVSRLRELLADGVVRARKPAPPAERAAGRRDLARRRLPDAPARRRAGGGPRRRRPPRRGLGALARGPATPGRLPPLPRRLARRLRDRRLVRLAVGRRKGARGRLAGPPARRAGRSGRGLPGRPPRRGGARGSGDRGRRRLVDPARLPRGLARAAEPARRAGGDRTRLRRPGARARDRVPGLRDAALPSQARPGGAERVPAPPALPADGRLRADRRLRRPRPARPGRGPRLPDARARPLACREPAAGAVPARPRRPVLRRLAAAGAARAARARPPAAGLRARPGSRAELRRRPAPRARSGRFRRRARGGAAGSAADRRPGRADVPSVRLAGRLGRDALPALGRSHCGDGAGVFGRPVRRLARRLVPRQRGDRRRRPRRRLGEAPARASGPVRSPRHSRARARAARGRAPVHRLGRPARKRRSPVRRDGAARPLAGDRGPAGRARPAGARADALRRAPRLDRGARRVLSRYVATQVENCDVSRVSLLVAVAVTTWPEWSAGSVICVLPVPLESVVTFTKPSTVLPSPAPDGSHDGLTRTSRPNSVDGANPCRWSLIVVTPPLVVTDLTVGAGWRSLPPDLRWMPSPPFEKIELPRIVFATE